MRTDDAPLFTLRQAALTQSSQVYKQSSEVAVSYPVAVKNILAKDGIYGLFFRGLDTKIIANGMQGILFSILWKQFEVILFPKK